MARDVQKFVDGFGTLADFGDVVRMSGATWKCTPDVVPVMVAFRGVRQDISLGEWDGLVHSVKHRQNMSAIVPVVHGDGARVPVDHRASRVCPMPENPLSLLSCPAGEVRSSQPCRTH
eukprot:6723008-Pyramimonas_sp.AAC.1